MKGKGYDFEGGKHKTTYEFQSNGPKGAITKVVLFDKLGENMWNLAFGDKVEGSIFLDDEKVSNNGDLRLVIQTVVNITHDFLQNHPGQTLYIRPVDEKRRSLYNHVFRKKWPEIRSTFSVFGIAGNFFENYQPGKLYDIFVVSLKPGTFEN